MSMNKQLLLAAFWLGAFFVLFQHMRPHSIPKTCLTVVKSLDDGRGVMLIRGDDVLAAYNTLPPQLCYGNRALGEVKCKNAIETPEIF